VDYSTLTDETLIRLIARTQPEALSALYDRYNRLVFSLALNVVGDRATAEEITLDVFTRIWERASSYQPDQARVNTWLSRITRNRSIDILRRRSSRVEQLTVSWADITAEAIPNGSPNPEDFAELALRQARVRAAIAQLPAEQQHALALAYFKGYSHRQIAELLDQPLGTIKTRLRLALQKLRQQLGNE
jgi:RNA polymerase sigma-70 factor (ECF subfamily)